MGTEIYFEEMMKRGIKGMKGKDQKDKTAISLCTALLLSAGPDILECREIESYLYLLPLHLSSRVIATSLLVIYLHQRGFFSY